MCTLHFTTCGNINAILPVVAVIFFGQDTKSSSQKILRSSGIVSGKLVSVGDTGKILHFVIRGRLVQYF